MQRERLICWLSFSLVLLVFLNMMLFYKLWMLEYSAQSLTTWQGLRLHERCTHTHTFYIFSTYLYKTNLLQRAIFKWYFREWPHLSLQKLMEFCWSYLAIAHKYTHTATDIHMHTKLYPCDCLLTQLTVFPSKLPQTQMEWAQLLEAQQRYHDAELQKWREIIKSSVVLLDQVQQRLCLLLFGVMGRLCVTEFTTEVGGGTMDKRRASVPVLPFIVWIITKHTVVSSDPAHYKSSTSYFGNCSFDCLR